MNLKLCLLLCGALCAFPMPAALAETVVPVPVPKPDFSDRNDGGPDFLDKVGAFFSDIVNPDESADSGEPQSTAFSVPLPPEKPVFENNVKKRSFSFFDRLQDRETHNTLSREDSELYKEIFAAQRVGDMDRADALLQQVSNPLLLGHVLYQRYMHPSAYRSDYRELQDWLARYADHPGADKIYALAQRKNPDADIQNLEKPAAYQGLARLREPTMRPAQRYSSARARSPEDRSKMRVLTEKVRSFIRQGTPDQALMLLQQDRSARIVDPVEQDLLLSEIAASFLYEGDTQNAYRLATQAAQRSGLHVPKAGWVAGLVSWKEEKYAQAARFFEMAGRSPYASGWMLTAASYWAARAHMRSGNVKAVSPWLKRGVKYPRTFYGLISTRALGQDFDFNWAMPTFTKTHHDALIAIPAGARAVALAKIGRKELAQSELLRIKPENAQTRAAFLAFAGYANLPALAMRLASAMPKPEEGSYYDAALYPVIPWKPEGGYHIDKALLHAVMKQESRFDPHAQSSSGATGLMQLMPATALSIDRDAGDSLEVPQVNLRVGQRYLEHLLGLPMIDNNLLDLLIAYNAGPGNLARWRERWPGVHDPLLFIEVIPSAETRTYIERVLANYWIYRMRGGQSLETLDALAAGQAPLYKASEDDEVSQ